MRTNPTLLAALLAGCLLLGCGSAALRVDGFAGVDALLLGEQHDDPAHQRQHLQVVEALAGSGRLAAVALEMAEVGRSTAGLSRTVEEAAVRTALGWQDQAWPWALYGPAVMAAVREGVPVLGASLPRDQMRAAMADAALDGTLDPQALAAQQEAIRVGHCGMLPARQIGPMVRVQLARDQAMARTIAGAALPGKTVVLLAGAGHVDPALGVPRHLPPSLKVRPVRLPASGSAPVLDHCEALRRQLAPAPAPAR